MDEINSKSLVRAIVADNWYRGAYIQNSHLCILHLISIPY